jgi:transglutaminase-like putative cysteine protease
MVRHVTELSYGSHVEEAHSEVRKSPGDTGLQRVVTSKLEVEPQTLLRKHRDYFGNVVHHFDLLDPHAALRISAESVVETTHAVACGPESAPDPRPWEERWAEYLCASPFVPDLPHYAEIRHGVNPRLDPDEFLSALQALGAVLKRDFRYEANLTEVDSSPAVFFEKGGGVCQDFTHAAIGILRLARVPARYASGYLYDPATDPAHSELRGAAASHAWAQAWHPALGWVGLDPTNDQLVDWQYVRVAVGRDYGDVQPVRGVFRGAGEQRLTVSVAVTRLAGGA